MFSSDKVSFFDNLPSNIQFSDKSLFSKKISNFTSSYKSDKNSLICLLDFDLTVTAKYNYQTKKEYKSSYYFYDESLIDSSERDYYGKVKQLTATYSRYETDFTLDYNLRKEKTREWYCSSLSLYANPKFTFDSIDKMIQARKDSFCFRGKVKEFFELLMEMEIPIIIISGGITQFIEGALKTVFPNIDKLLQEKKISIVSNNLVFAGENKSCSGFDENIVYQFNKADVVKKFVEEKYSKAKNILVVGDHPADSHMISKIDINKENVLGFGFYNVQPDYIGDEKYKDEVEEHVNEYKNNYDIVFVGDCDYCSLIKVMKNIGEKEK